MIAPRDMAVGTIFMLQTTIGLLGKFPLLYHYVFFYCTGCRLRSTDFIVMNLIVANTFVLSSNGISSSMSSFAWYHIFADFGHKFIYYVRRVGRIVSIGATCFLSVLQAITISPMNSRWAHLKGKAPMYIFSSMFFYWLLQMLVSIIYFMFTTGILNNNNITNRKSFGYCASVRHNKIADALYAALLSTPDVLCFVLMLGVCDSMLFILHRHQHRVQHVHRTHISSRSSPESRATTIIFLLVSTFLFFFNTFSFIFAIFLAIFKNLSWFILITRRAIRTAITLCFPSVSPFLLLNREPCVSRLSFA